MEDQQDEFNYDEGSERGPSKWGTLKSEWKDCAEGKSQTPIELYQRVKHAPNLGHLNRSYKSASATIGSSGHAVEVEWEGDAGGIKIGKTSYKLIQCHWHTPTEHSVYGKRFEMELHMVHKTSNGTIAVVAFMYMFGESDPFLTKVKSVSPLQVQALKNAVHKGFQRNARPSQLLNGRTVHVYN
ncbi:Alpha carbonic anhydrase 7 [Linum perenne]